MRYYLIYLLLFTGCGNAKTHDLKDSKGDDTTLIKDSFIADSLCRSKSFEINKLKNGFFYKFDFINEKNYRVIWGTTSASHKSEKVFEKLGSGTLDYLTCNENAIFLSQVCGTSCTFFVILPINGGIEKIFYEPQAVDLKRNLIAYVPNEVNSPDSKAFINIENFLSGQKIEIKESNLCSAVSKGDCIDCCYFIDKEFYLKWQGSKWTSKSPDTQVKKISVSGL